MKNQTASPLPLTDLSTGWLTRRRGVPAAMPGLTHETGSVQAEADLCAIKHPIFPPYSASGETTGQAVYGDRLLCQRAQNVRIRWTAWKIERQCSYDDWDFSSETCLVPNEPVVVVRWKIRNRSGKARKLPFGLVLSGRGRNSGNDGYAWSVPEVPTDVLQLRARLGLRVGVEAMKNGFLFSSGDEPAFSEQVVSSGARLDVSLTTVRWEAKVAAGGEWSGYLVATYGDSKSAVRSLAKKWTPKVDEAFVAAKEWWSELWQSAFTPGNAHFSGHLPIVESSDAFIAKLYYMGVLTLLCLRRRYAHSLLESGYLTLGPRRGEGSIYLAWDLPYISQLLARLDPAALKAHWAALCTAPLFSHMVLNLFNKEHTSFPCVADPLARVTPLVELSRRGHLGDALAMRIRRQGKSLTSFKKNGEAVYGEDETRDLTGVEALVEAATTHRRFHLGRTGLVDYGDRGNYLECCTTYAHGTAGHTSVQAWALEAAGTITGRRIAKASEIKNLQKAAMSLYRPGEGYFDCLHPDGRRHPTPNLYDLGLVLNAMGPELDPKVVKEIARFTEKHLTTPTWARCLAAFDPDSASGLRCDHQWAGCFGAWPGQFIMGLHKANHRPKWVAEWAAGLAEVTKQGPFAQAYFAEDVVDPEFGGAAKAFDDFPQGNHWLISSGALYAHVVLESLLGYEGESLNPWPGLSKDCRVTNQATRD
ncbi:MAG: hypothetical protein NTV93_11175 [Verrucomicrobia bacterium]|nr:hypothetical protein [Verrucomicrobiota bacterium]